MANSAQNNNDGFVNPAFKEIFEGITAYMPMISFWSIIGSYAVTGALNAFLLPLPLFITIPGAVFLQLIRFNVVFNDFQNPTGRRSPYPALVGGLLTILALFELRYGLSGGGFTADKFWSMFLFGAALIGGGFLVEMTFISKGAEAFKLGKAYREIKGATSTTPPAKEERTAREAYDEYMALAEKETRHAIEANQLPRPPARRVNPAELRNRAANRSTDTGADDFLELSPINHNGHS
jgi:hypothetical protein